MEDIPTYPSWERYTVLSSVVNSLPTRDKRYIFSVARENHDVAPLVFFPLLGLSLTEFAVWYTLNDARRVEKERAGL